MWPRPRETIYLTVGSSVCSAEDTGKPYKSVTTLGGGPLWGHSRYFWGVNESYWALRGLGDHGAGYWTAMLLAPFERFLGLFRPGRWASTNLVGGLALIW